MKNSKNIKIIVSYHKPACLLKSDIFMPIHAGRAIAREKSKYGNASESDLTWLFSNMRGDDSGENISAFNRELNEMTAIYWAWKNLTGNGGGADKVDYIGHMHYRRIFDFEDIFFSRWRRDCERLHASDGEFPELILRTMFMPSNEVVRNCLRECDALIPCAHTNEHFLERKGNLSEPYIPIPLVRKYLEILQEKNPTADIDRALRSSKRHFWNIFVFRRDVFNAFCEFVFPPVFEFCSRFKDEFIAEKPGLSPMRLRRTPGFLAELSFHIFCSNLIARGNVSVRECGVVQFKELATASNLGEFPMRFGKIAEAACNYFFRLDAEKRMKHKWRLISSWELLKRKF